MDAEHAQPEKLEKVVEAAAKAVRPSRAQRRAAGARTPIARHAALNRARRRGQPLLNRTAVQIGCTIDDSPESLGRCKAMIREAIRKQLAGRPSGDVEFTIYTKTATALTVLVDMSDQARRQAEGRGAKFVDPYAAARDHLVAAPAARLVVGKCQTSAPQ